MRDLFNGKSKTTADISIWEINRDIFVGSVRLSDYYSTLPSDAAINQFLSNPLILDEISRDMRRPLIDTAGLGDFSPDNIAVERDRSIRVENDIIVLVLDFMHTVQNGTLPGTVTVPGDIVNNLLEFIRYMGYYYVTEIIKDTLPAFSETESVTFYS